MKRICVGAEVVKWVAKRTNEFGDFGCSSGIGLQKKAGDEWRMVAGVAYADWNGVNVVCHIASEGPHWLNREFLWTIFDYPFNQLKVKRITVTVGEGNKSSLRFVAHLGFTLEANLRDAHPTGDLLVWRMFREGCKWISQDIYKPLAKAA